MNFLKKHYEKMLLVVMLCLFIFIMIYVMRVAEQAKTVSDKDLALPTFKIDYQAHDPKDQQFNPVKLLEKAAIHWKESAAREKTAAASGNTPELYSDIVVPFAIASCAHCKKLVPFWYFNKRLCPSCGKELAKPSEQRRRINVITANDSDGDGMPNSYEKEMGLNPTDPLDALTDMDGDGFSNLFEYENETSPKNPKDHPPLWYRLRFMDVRRIELPIKFMAVSPVDPKDKSSWSIQLNFPVMKKGKIQRDKKGEVITKSDVVKLNDVLALDNRKYKITEVEELKQTSTKGKKDVDNSYIKVVEVLPQGSAGDKQPDILVMRAGQTVFSNDERLVLEDVGKAVNRDTYILRAGDLLTLGIKKTGREKIALKTIDRIHKKAQFMRTDNKSSENPDVDRKGKKIIVTAKSEIPNDLWVFSVKSDAERSKRSKEQKESSSDVQGR